MAYVSPLQSVLHICSSLKFFSVHFLPDIGQLAATLMMKAVMEYISTLVSGFAHHGGIQWGSNIPLAWDAWLYFARIPTLKRMELVLSSGNWWIIFAQYDIYFVHSRIQTCDLRFVGFCRPRSLSFPSWPDPKHRRLVFVDDDCLPLPAITLVFHQLD